MGSFSLTNITDLNENFSDTVILIIRITSFPCINNVCAYFYQCIWKSITLFIKKHITMYRTVLCCEGRCPPKTPIGPSPPLDKDMWLKLWNFTTGFPWNQPLGRNWHKIFCLYSMFSFFIYFFLSYFQLFIISATVIEILKYSIRGKYYLENFVNYGSLVTLRNKSFAHDTEMRLLVWTLQ